MTLCPKCQAPERPDHQSAVEVGSKIRLACLMGHSRWVEFDVRALEPKRPRDPRAGLLPTASIPPRPCLRCRLMIEHPLAANQRRHGRCAEAHTRERRTATRPRKKGGGKRGGRRDKGQRGGPMRVAAAQAP